MSYNTGNSIGSTDPRDLYDNAENLDQAMNANQDEWTDRFGLRRATFRAAERAADQAVNVDIPYQVSRVEPAAQLYFENAESDREDEFAVSQQDKQQRFNTFIASSGYTGTGSNGAVEDYTAGIEITEYNQIVRDPGNGEFWRLSGSTPLPYTTDGTGLPEGGSLVGLGDAVLRQDIGNPGGPLASYTIGGSIRRDTQFGPNWFVISDSAHHPINLSSVDDGVNVVISHEGDSIGTMIVSPDETLATKCVSAGVSGGKTSSIVSMGAHCTALYDLDLLSASEYDEGLFDSSRFSATVSASGLVTLKHPASKSGKSRSVIHTNNSLSDGKIDTVNIQNQASGVTTFFLMSTVRGRLDYYTAWGITNVPGFMSESDISFSHDSGTGELTVEHPICQSNEIPAISSYYSGSNPIRMPVIKSHTKESFVVRFFDTTTGQVVKEPGVGMGFSFSRNGMLLTPGMSLGSVRVDAGPVQVDMNQVDVQGGNLWVHGTTGRNS